MKRFGQFIILFLCLMAIAYTLPILFPQKETAMPLSKELKTDVTVSHTSFPHGELKASGFSAYIDQPTEAFTKVYGEPLEIQQTALGYDWWILGENQHDYLQVAVKNNKITSIFSLGDELSNAPFEIGMKLADISEITTIYPNFDFTKKEINYKIELTEEDMNYRPLVAFDNGSFAILHLTQETGKLIGVRYLNQATLLRLMPYQLNQGELVEKANQKEIDWELVNLDSQRQMQSILTILRQRGKYEPYEYPKVLTDRTEDVLRDVIENPSKYIKDQGRLGAWEEHKLTYQFSQPFKLSSEEFSSVLAIANIEEKTHHGMIYSPSYDVPFLVMTWYSEALSQFHFTHQDDHEVGIAFYQDVVLFILAEKEETAIDGSTSMSVESRETSESSQKDSSKNNL